ncbi:RNA polymerase sigma70 [Stenotrophomonas daejeonensis]|uniref:RNA polymerase sigma70 n=1 Tax=Stenotrophomonas daejeonensis TaxID=659018 RepID=A0A0R0E8Q4_9GAMM|nr:ECF-type sigma factor [Stenotrophomonas daejeonensis]KRG87303.1 RNA polymerase sigma70 [Stenotrophomonas daejeonensis]
METQPPSADITGLIRRWQHGDREASAVLAEEVYQELHGIAVRRLAHGGQAGLQATELLHEAWIRLSANQHPFQSRAHFYAVAALKMRNLLIDLARMQASQKRGGDLRPLTLTVTLLDPSPQPEDLQLMAEAFDQLTRMDERKAQAFALNELAGFSIAETAELLDVSPATLQRDLRFTRAWLATRLSC